MDQHQIGKQHKPRQRSPQQIAGHDSERDLKLCQKRLVKRLDQRGMLTLEAAVLTPAGVMMAVLVILVMLFEFQSLLMVVGMHQYGTTEIHHVDTERLNLEKGLKVMGHVKMKRSLELGGSGGGAAGAGAVADGLRTLKLDGSLEPAHPWLERLSDIKSRSFHVRIPVDFLIFGIYHFSPEP